MREVISSQLLLSLLYASPTVFEAVEQMLLPVLVPALVPAPDLAVSEGVLRELGWQRGVLMRLESGMKALSRGSATSDAASNEEAVRVFGLMKVLEDGVRCRKAPLGRVFRLLTLDGLAQAAVAVRCGCSPGLVSLRVSEIERRMKRPISELRALASRLGDLGATVEDDRARKIYRRGFAEEG